jgi:putative membrane protein
MDLSVLPTVNAVLNGLATVCLLVGWVNIRQRRIAAHRAAMIAAVTCSALFLISYVVYHAQAGSKPFEGSGRIRLVYFVILVSHIILAAAIVPMVLVTLARALYARYERHRAIARWTLPVWLYVSVTGVVVYVMLYHGRW